MYDVENGVLYDNLEFPEFFKCQFHYFVISYCDVIWHPINKRMANVNGLELFYIIVEFPSLLWCLSRDFYVWRKNLF